MRPLPGVAAAFRIKRGVAEDWLQLGWALLQPLLAFLLLW